MLLMMYNESLEMESMDAETRRSENYYMILYAKYSEQKVCVCNSVMISWCSYLPKFGTYCTRRAHLNNQAVNNIL